MAVVKTSLFVFERWTINAGKNVQYPIFTAKTPVESPLLKLTLHISHIKLRMACKQSQALVHSNTVRIGDNPSLSQSLVKLTHISTWGQ